jgi:transcriptional regulator with XRE-family HTH domain
MNMNTTLAIRIQEIIDAGFSQADLYRAAGVSKGTANQWLDGRIKSIKLEYAQGIQTMTGFNANWIVTGKGEKMASDVSNESGEKLDQAKTGADFPEHVNAVVSLMMQTDDRGMRKIRDAAEEALDKYRISQKSMADISTLNISPELLESKEFIKAINLLVRTFSKEELIQKSN